MVDNPSGEVIPVAKFYKEPKSPSLADDVKAITPQDTKR